MRSYTGALIRAEVLIGNFNYQSNLFSPDIPPLGPYLGQALFWTFMALLLDVTLCVHGTPQ